MQKIVNDQLIHELFRSTQEQIYLLEKSYLNFSNPNVRLNSSDATKNEMKKVEKKFRIKEEFVQEVHRKEDGTARIINAPNESASGPLLLWNTRLPNGKRKTASTYQALIEALYEYYGGELYYFDFSVKNVWTEALADYQTKGCREDKTVREQQKEYKRWINEEFEKTDIRKIDSEWLDNYLKPIIKQAAKDPDSMIKKKAFYNMKSMLNILFDFAAKENYIPENPARKLDFNDYKKYLDNSLVRRTRNDVMPTFSEFEKIFNELEKQSKSPQFKGYYIYLNAAKIQNLIGCRPGELAVLKWKNIQKDVLIINEQQRIIPSNKETQNKTAYITVPYTKNERGNSQGGRMVPIDPFLQDILNKLKEMQEKFGVHSEYILCNIDGSPMKSDAYRDCLGNVLRKLDIPRHGTYIFRRNANCRFAEMGINTDDRGKLLGNTSGVNTRCYTYESEDYLNNARRVNLASSHPWM